LNEQTTEFEDGKPIEEYVAELDKLNLDVAEKVPEGQPLEDVVEAVEKPQKKKKEQPQPVITPQPSPTKPQEQQPPIPQEKSSSAPQEQSTPEQQSQPEPQQQIFSGIDDYIQKQREQIEQEYTKQGKIVSQQFVDNSYRNLVAVITGQVRLVPIEQQQPPPQPQPAPEKPIVDNTESIRQIDAMLKDPSLKDIRKALLKRKCDLLGVEFSDDLVPADPVPTQPAPSQHDLPLNPKVVKPPKKKWPRWKALAYGLISLVVGVSVAFIISYIIFLLS
jgi:pyruvate/2-oxoglutarate dehydrogenase complex dihydrolipoamide acyltransferase (E2) component